MLRNGNESISLAGDRLNESGAARHIAQGLDLEEYRRLQSEVRSAWPATTKLQGLDFDRAVLAFIAERWIDKAA